MLGLFRAEPEANGEWRHLVLRDGQVLPVRWVRDRRARRLRLIVGEHGVRLTLPPGASVRMAEAFLFEHRDWLAEQVARRPPPDRSPFRIGEEPSLPLRGQDWPLAWREGRFLRVELGDDGIAITRTARSGARQVAAALRDFYEQQARADLGRWLPKYLPALPRAPSGFRFRPLSSLWGSLSVEDGVLLDLALVLGRPSAFEYVLVHELCHLIHRNHGPRYWREVERRWPDWRSERDYLHGDGPGLKSRMRRITGKKPPGDQSIPVSTELPI